MEYTKENLKGWAEYLKGHYKDKGDTLNMYASAWAQEVAELRELCDLKDREAASFDDEPLLPDSDYDRMGELWEKHMEGGEG